LTADNADSTDVFLSVASALSAVISSAEHDANRWAAKNGEEQELAAAGRCGVISLAVSKVEEIERAVEQLAPPDFARFAAWIDARHHAEWTQQLDREAAGGKLDFLFEEAEAERLEGQLRDWPPPKP
jgi:hypothetical protein